MTEVVFSGIVCSPELRTLLLSVGWDRYLDGLTLCSECVQNVDRLERVDERVRHRATKLNDKEPEPERKRKTDEEILIALQEANGNKSRAAKNLGFTTNGFFFRCRKIRDKNGGVLPELNNNNHSTKNL